MIDGNIFGRVESINVGVQDKEAVNVPESENEFRDAVFDRLFAVTDRCPRWLVCEEVPTQRIGAMLVEDFLRLAIVTHALGHLANFLGKLASAKLLFRFVFAESQFCCSASFALFLRFEPFAQHQTEHNAVAKRMRVIFSRRVVLLCLFGEQQRADREQAVEPTASLVECLTDEVCRELFFELLFALMRIAPLSERHRATVVPTVDDFRDPLHPGPFGEG